MKPQLGVCYYPEQWPPEVWAQDAQRMVDAGLSVVRVGEFAWSRLEPAPGDLHFTWLDDAIGILGQAGLGVVLGTPTATPPRWMLDKHPDMLALDLRGQARGFGSRRHYCFSHAGYLAECRRIVELLVLRYGDNPHLVAWQTDNEYGCHDTVLSYSAAALSGFQQWLKDRYETIGALNQAWGNVFWSMDYQRFDQVGLPNTAVTTPNPAHAMDFHRYSSEQVVRFNRAQAEIIRSHSKAPILHNYMGGVTDFDHFDTGADLDIAGWDSYPIGFLSDRVAAEAAHKERFLRQGDPDYQAFHHDLYRGVGRGRWWVVEQQPGPVNWAPWNPKPLPGMVRLWTLEAIAHGAELVSYFRWRQVPFAQEQMHAGLLLANSEAAPVLEEVQATAGEISELGAMDPGPAETAIVFDYPSAWAWAIERQGADFDYLELVFAFYRGLRRLGLNIDFVPASTTDFSAYKLVLAPGLFHMPTALQKALKTAGGSILAGPRANAKTPHFAIPAALAPDLEGFDLRVVEVESLPPSARIELAAGGHFLRWFEHVRTGHTVIETTKDGLAAWVADGPFNYLCGWPDAVSLHRILAHLAAQNGLETKDLPEPLRMRKTATHQFIFNYGAEPAKLWGKTIPAAGVLWQSL